MAKEQDAFLLESMEGRHIRGEGKDWNSNGRSRIVWAGGLRHYTHPFAYGAESICFLKEEDNKSCHSLKVDCTKEILGMGNDVVL